MHQDALERMHARAATQSGSNSNHAAAPATAKSGPAICEWRKTTHHGVLERSHRAKRAVSRERRLGTTQFAHRDSGEQRDTPLFPAAAPVTGPRDGWSVSARSPQAGKPRQRTSIQLHSTAPVSLNGHPRHHPGRQHHQRPISPPSTGTPTIQPMTIAVLTSSFSLGGEGGSDRQSLGGDVRLLEIAERHERTMAVNAGPAVASSISSSSLLEAAELGLNYNPRSGLV